MWELAASLGSTGAVEGKQDSQLPNTRRLVGAINGSTRRSSTLAFPQRPVRGVNSSASTDCSPTGL